MDLSHSDSGNHLIFWKSLISLPRPINTLLKGWEHGTKYKKYIKSVARRAPKCIPFKEHSPYYSCVLVLHFMELMFLILFYNGTRIIINFSTINLKESRYKSIAYYLISDSSFITYNRTVDLLFYPSFLMTVITTDG